MKSSTELFAAQHDESILALDLHGMNRSQAREELDIFINQAHFTKEPYVKVICGRGHGILQKEVVQLLKNHKLIRTFEGGTAPHEIGAVYYVLLYN